MEGWCYVKVHRRGKDVVVAVCDEELLGLSLYANGFEIKVDKEFYGGERVPISALWDYLREATIVNAIGNHVVAAIAEKISVAAEAAVELGGKLHIQLILK